jgi:hypothetical protein
MRPQNSSYKGRQMTPIDVTYPNLLQLFPKYLVPKRSESAPQMMNIASPVITISREINGIQTYLDLTLERF